MLVAQIKRQTSTGATLAVAALYILFGGGIAAAQAPGSELAALGGPPSVSSTCAPLPETNPVEGCSCSIPGSPAEVKLTEELPGNGEANSLPAETVTVDRVCGSAPSVPSELHPVVAGAVPSR